MPDNATQKQVLWFDDGKRPNVTDELAKHRDIVVHCLTPQGPAADNWGAMAASQVYCITSTRQEIPDQYKCHAELIARCPDLLAVSTTGAGYDTVDVPACTAAGVLVNLEWATPSYMATLGLIRWHRKQREAQES